MVAVMPTTEKKRRAVNVQPRPHLSARLLARRDEQTRLLGVKIKRLKLNDALVCGRLRLVWVQARRHYFVLYRGERRFGKVEVRSGYPSPEKIERLAALLTLVGFMPDKTRCIVAGVRGLPRGLNRVPNLFTLSDE